MKDHVIWGFSEESDFLCSDRNTHWLGRPAPSKAGDHESEEDQIWARIDDLLELALLEQVPHLAESESPDCELIHAFAIEGTGEPLERELAKAADHAGRHLLRERGFPGAGRNAAYFIPFPANRPNMQMVGVFRLTHRPRTRLEADWLRRMEENASEWLAIYRELAPPKQLWGASTAIQ